MYLLGLISNLFEGPSGLILLVIILLLFGAKRIPELARSLGSAINEFNKAKDDVHRQIAQAAEPPPVAPVPPIAPPNVMTTPEASQPHPPQDQLPKA